MAFFEDIGKKLTDVGQNVARQTKNFSDITQLNSSISDSEKRISQLFIQLGKEYYENHKDEENEVISEISRLYTQIFECREKIKQIKGVTKCESCGADVPLESAFCNSCGAKVNKHPSAELCKFCGEPMKSGDKFCTRCGNKQ